MFQNILKQGTYLLHLYCSIITLFDMKFSEFYKLIEAAGWTLSKGKNITSMFIPTTSTLFQLDAIHRKKFPREL